MPEHFDQPAAPAGKDEQMAIVRIAFECLLHEQGETIKPLANVGVAARQPYLHAARHRDHRRRPAFASIVIIARTSERSVGPVIRTREPFANSTSIVPEAGIPFGAGAAAIRTAAKFAAGCARAQSCRRHPYNWLGCIPAWRATADTPVPGSSDVAISRSFSSAVQRRRRCTEVMTSIAVLLMGLFL